MGAGKKLGKPRLSKVRDKSGVGENVEAKAGVEEQAEGVPELPPDLEYDGGAPNSGNSEECIGPSQIVWTPSKRRAGDLTFWDRNPRRITDSQTKHLATSLIKFGYADPILINTDGMIIGGHMRYRIMLQAGLIHGETLLNVMVPSRSLDPDEVEEMAIRLNKNTGDWDWDLLVTNFDQSKLREFGFSPMDFGMATSGIDPIPTATIPVADSNLKPTGLKPSPPRICPHCEERCHCVIEEH